MNPTIASMMAAMSASREPIADSPAPGPTYAAAVEGKRKVLAAKNIAFESSEKTFKGMAPFVIKNVWPVNSCW